MQSHEPYQTVDKTVNPIVVTIENGALAKLAPFLPDHGYRRPFVIMDENTDRAAGRKVIAQLDQAGITNDRYLIGSNRHGDVIADEPTLVRTLLGVPKEADILIAVGAGTIHDITRFTADRMKIPFLSVPTAASVDGFASKGAPIILGGVKKTIQTCAPLAIIADVDVLQNAPRLMVAAGVGDMVGKYTSLIDWRLSHLLADEPYDKDAAAKTCRALESCVANLEPIAHQTEAGLKVLMEALIQSGEAMMQVGHSRPASGAEHHLSHYWEMELLRKNKPQILHGAKVGVATILIADLYHRLSEIDIAAALGDAEISDQRKNRLQAHWPRVQKLLQTLPLPSELAALLRAVGGPTTPQEIGISTDLVQRSLREAHHLRDRYTGLKIAYELNQLL
ncbi:sn-glycerol-1-phosphate dehydrogenase [Desmospora activa]|uniref:Glycerol-1-phosphate dehydrogenase [NAD(P)+] n=1 Tax=Desmospora activa DSM 45169 TaxID=1121389 RepID=A0A2T4Z7V6_9BACL|nr:sn-glycerol-1-phosphate dehydrogenase [Desmospora activa]PTM57970.1 glycerol-1-phosphate dehydrogenase [NAD(P)+] [Desmospora activa DSM 45169]